MSFSASTTSGLLVARALRCERDDRPLFTDLDLTLDAGQIIQVAGANGSGKTTLLRILAGLYTQYQGALLFQGQPLEQNRAVFNQSLLFIGHKSAIKPTLTVLENLRFLVGLHQTPDQAQLFSALDSVGLAGYEHVLCQNLSAGQQRRVALARLWLSTARIWVLDEIFTAIDLDGVAQLEALLARKAEQGHAIVLTTHHRLQLPSLSQITLGADYA